MSFVSKKMSFFIRLTFIIFIAFFFIETKIFSNQKVYANGIEVKKEKYWYGPNYAISDMLFKYFQEKSIEDRREKVGEMWTEYLNNLEFYRDSAAHRIEDINNWDSSLTSRHKYLKDYLQSEIKKRVERIASFNRYIENRRTFDLKKLLELEESKIKEIVNKLQDEDDEIKNMILRLVKRSFLDRPDYSNFIKIDESCKNLEPEVYKLFHMTMQDVFYISFPRRNSDFLYFKRTTEKLTDLNRSLQVRCEENKISQKPSLSKNSLIWYWSKENLEESSSSRSGFISGSESLFVLYLLTRSS